MHCNRTATLAREGTVRLSDRKFRSRECLLEIPEKERHAQMISCVEFHMGIKAGLWQLVPPAKAARIVVVDDLPECVHAMGTVLSAWKANVEFEAVLQKAGMDIEVPRAANLLLLDEKMDCLEGREVAAALRGMGFSGIICSTSTSYTEYHDFKFQGKRPLMAGDYAVFVEDFVQVMNGIFSSPEFR